MAKKEVYNIDLSQGTRQNSNRNSSNRNRQPERDRRRPNGGEKMSRAQMKKKKRKKMLIIEVVVLLLVLAALLVWLKLGKISWDDLKNLRMNKLDDETAELLDGYTNIALFGVDNRSNGNYDGGNSDSIMICSINNDTKEVKLISVYRDTCMDVDGEGTYRKCNYAYNHGGPKQAIEMLNRNLDLNIQKYVAVDFYALAEAVDALGGVELDITEAEASYMNGGGYIEETARVVGGKAQYVSVGPQTVNGIQAVAYCRIRYTAGGDFGRAERQRTVVEQMIKKLDGASAKELNKLIDAVFDDVGTNFKVSQLIEMASYFKDYKLAETRGFPYDMQSKDLGGKLGSTVVPCTLKTNVEKLHEDLFGNEDMKVSKEVERINKDIKELTGMDKDDAVDYGY